MLKFRDVKDVKVLLGESFLFLYLKLNRCLIASPQ